jgi:hypothetical protein
MVECWDGFKSHDGPWAEGPFTPGASFQEFGSLFETEAKLRHAQIIGVWETNADKIEALGIEVVGENGDVHERLNVFVENGKAIVSRFRPGPLLG